MATKLAPAHRTREGQPIKTTDIARMRAHPREGARTPTHPRTRARVPARAPTCPYPACECREERD